MRNDFSTSLPPALRKPVFHMNTPHSSAACSSIPTCEVSVVTGHGLLIDIVQALKAETSTPTPNIRVIHETPTAVVLDGNGTLGYLPMVRATEHAIAKAKEVGIGMGLVRYIGHYGSAGHYARMCNEAGCIGFSVQGSRNHGNAGNQDTKPQLGYFGNPPICFAIPSGEEPPVVLDAATCIMADYQRGTRIRCPAFDHPCRFLQEHRLYRCGTLCSVAGSPASPNHHPKTPRNGALHKAVWYSQ